MKPKKSTVYDCSIVNLPQVNAGGGNITSINNQIEICFETRRVYYLYDVPGGEARGGHGHKELQQLIVAATGSFDLTIDDGFVKRTFNLNRPNIGVHMPAGLWRELHNFSSGSICLVLASLEYSEDDYIRNYDEFINFKK
jgi:hypothetical protein